SQCLEAAHAAPDDAAAILAAWEPPGSRGPPDLGAERWEIWGGPAAQKLDFWLQPDACSPPDDILNLDDQVPDVSSRRPASIQKEIRVLLRNFGVTHAVQLQTSRVDETTGRVAIGIHEHRTQAVSGRLGRATRFLHALHAGTQVGSIFTLKAIGSTQVNASQIPALEPAGPVGKVQIGDAERGAP